MFNSGYKQFFAEFFHLRKIHRSKQEITRTRHYLPCILNDFIFEIKKFSFHFYNRIKRGNVEHIQDTTLRSEMKTATQGHPMVFNER